MVDLPRNSVSCLVIPLKLIMSLRSFGVFLIWFKILMWFRLVSCCFHRLLRNIMNSWRIASCSWFPRRPSSFESWQRWVDSSLAMLSTLPIIEPMQIWYMYQLHLKQAALPATCLKIETHPLKCTDGMFCCVWRSIAHLGMVRKMM